MTGAGESVISMVPVVVAAGVVAGVSKKMLGKTQKRKAKHSKGKSKLTKKPHSRSKARKSSNKK